MKTKRKNTPIGVLIVDDHAVMRTGLASILGNRTEIDIVGEAADGEEAVRAALRLRPDVVLMDLMMPKMDGAEATRLLIREMPDVKVLILTTFGTADGIGHALEAGARGVILKNTSIEGLVDAIVSVAEGEHSICPEVEQIISRNPPIPVLSARQEEILNSVTRGLSNEDIARQLGISTPMVKEHLNAVFSKLGAANRTEAVAIALRRHLLKI